MTLSEKAKGKQKAVEIHVPNPEGHLLPTTRPTRDLVVRFTEGIPDLILTVDQHDAVRDVKRKV
jgi:hypothetical protein